MTADHSSDELRGIAAQFPGRIGHLFSSNSKYFRRHFGPFALDNGRYPAWKSGKPWKAADLFALYRRVATQGSAPLWLLVPDRVGEWRETMKEWDRWAGVLCERGWPLALAVQDGATVDDVRAIQPDVVFVGGTTRFKWETFARWCGEFPRVHVGRVNTPREAWRCWKAGAESVDGTGWMRTDRQRAGLMRLLLAMRDGERPTMPELFPCESVA